MCAMCHAPTGTAFGLPGGSTGRFSRVCCCVRSSGPPISHMLDCPPNSPARALHNLLLVAHLQLGKPAAAEPRAAAEREGPDGSTVG